MPVKRTKHARTGSNNEQLSRELRYNRMVLFTQQFEKEAQERMNELESKLENMLSTVDKVFKVELMKMPLSLQNARVAELISEAEISASEVSIAMRTETREMEQPLRKMPRKRGKSEDSSAVHSTSAQRVSTKTSKGVKGEKKPRALAGSKSTGNVRGSSATVKRTVSRVAKQSSDAQPTKPKLRAVVSAGDLSCSMAGSDAHITVTTALGKTVSFSEENKDEINLDMLDDVAWCQIQKLTRVMESLSGRCNR